MFEIRQIRELKERKAFLISECALERSLIASETTVLEQKLRWPKLLFSGLMLVLPKLQLLLPVAGWLISRRFSRRSKAVAPAPAWGGGVGFVGWFRRGVMVWQLFKKGRQFWSQWRQQRDLRNLR